MSRTDAPDASSVRRLEFSIDWPPGHSAAYLIPGAEPVLIDAGVPGETGRKELHEGLEEHGYEPSDIDHLVLTHAHADHVGQVSTVLESSETRLYAPEMLRRRFERDIDTIRRATKANMAEAGVPQSLLSEGLERQIENTERIRDAIPLTDVDEWIEDRDTIDIGEHSFEAIYSPGHHVTHVCYRTSIDSESVMFSGDVAIEPFRPFTIHTNFDDGVTDGVTAFLDTLERLLEYPTARVFPGHGPRHSNYRDALEDSIADLNDRIEACHENLRESGSTAVHISGNISDGFEEASRLLPEVVGALSHLEREGRAISELEDGVRYYRPA